LRHRKTLPSARASSSAASEAGAGDAAAAAAAAPQNAEPAALPAVYIKAPLPAGAQVSYPGCSVVVLGDVPASCRVEAGGDVVVLGR
jgi:septum formation inhibitor MinC